MMTLDDMGGGGVVENDDVICEQSKYTKFVNKMGCFGLFLCIIGVLFVNKPLKWRGDMWHFATQISLLDI